MLNLMLKGETKKMCNEKKIYRKKVEPRQEWIGKEFNFDPDSSPEAWDHYQEYYNDVGSLGKLTLVNQKDYNRLKSEISVCGITYDIAGDCSFNFNEKKVKIFKTIINGDPSISDEDKKKLKELLDKCNENHYTLLNFDLIPVTGGMNNLKGNLKYKDENVMVHDMGKPPTYGLLDRLDTFIYFLDYSFKKRNEFINSKHIDLKAIGEFFSNSVFTTSMKYENFKVLYDLLEKYSDIYEYCEVFYKIDSRKFVKKLIENGKKPIITAKDIENYMKLAYEFWNIKEQYFKGLSK